MEDNLTGVDLILFRIEQTEKEIQDALKANNTALAGVLQIEVDKYNERLRKYY